MNQPVVYLNGKFVPKSQATLSVDDRGFLFGDGVYEVIRSYGGALFELEAHLDRLTDGLAALRIAGVDSGSFREVAHRLMQDNGSIDEDALIYIQVTRGAAPRTHWFPDTNVPATTYAALFPFKAKGDPRIGIRVVTEPDIRWSRCDIKSVNLLANCLASQSARDQGVQDAIFVRDGVAIEGSSSSFFGVFGGTVRTAPRSNYILPSITRRVALELCHEAGIACEEAPIYAHELTHADELFLAGTTMEIMPIVEVDGRPVGGGTPGPIAGQLQELFTTRTVPQTVETK